MPCLKHKHNAFVRTGQLCKGKPKFNSSQLKHTGQGLCCSQFAEIQTYVICCLANSQFYKNPVSYLLFRTRIYYSTALPRSNISQKLTFNPQARCTVREVPVSISRQNIFPSDRENTPSLPAQSCTDSLQRLTETKQRD